MRKVRDWLLGRRTGPESVFRGARRRIPMRGRSYRRAVLAAVVGALAMCGGCLPVVAFAGSEGLPATVTVVAPSRALPEGMAEREVRIEQLEPLPFRDVVARVAEVIGVDAALEDRPGRVAGGDVVLDEPVPFGLAITGKVPAVLDELARLSGYDWSWSSGRLVFFRYADIEQREALRLPRGVAVGLLAAVAENAAEAAAALVGDEAESGETFNEKVAEAGRLAAAVPGQVDRGRDGTLDPEAVAAVEGKGEAAPAEQVPAEPAGWEVDPDRHDTVEAVLRAWADRAGWNLAWETERQFVVGAAAAFPAGESEEEGFLKAADALLAIAPVRRSLSVTAYPNRWLVVRDVGSVAQ